MKPRPSPAALVSLPPSPCAVLVSGDSLQRCCRLPAAASSRAAVTLQETPLQVLAAAAAAVSPAESALAQCSRLSHEVLSHAGPRSVSARKIRQGQLRSSLC
jgi:hypothetical protein